jgi:apolipoprotein N-acyltransferase
VNDSTVGVSAVFGPDGKTLDQLATFEPGVMVTKVPLRTGLTPAMAIGAGLDLFINIAAFALTALALPRLRRAKKKAPSLS